MQVAGMQFTTESRVAGNDLSTLPDFPAEIRAPAGTLAGVSGFQINFASTRCSRRDELDVLVAMNRKREGQPRRLGDPTACDRRQGSLHDQNLNESRV